MSRKTSAFMAIVLIVVVLETVLTTISFGQFDIAVLLGAFIGLFGSVILLSAIIGFISGAFKEGSFLDAFHLSFVLLVFPILLFQSFNLYGRFLR